MNLILFLFQQQNIGASIHIGQEIRCLLYAGFKKKIEIIRNMLRQQEILKETNRRSENL